MTPTVSGFWARAKGLAPRADRAARDFSVSRRLKCWLMEFSSRGLESGSGKQAHVRGDHAPALRHAHPGLALAAIARAAVAAEFDVGGGEVMAVGGDHRLQHFAPQALRG